MILHVLIAVLIGAGILLVGLAALRFASGGKREHDTPAVEDVADLDVFLVCGVCGTEFQVTRLGEIQIPRHCGETMQVVRRPRAEPAPG